MRATFSVEEPSGSITLFNSTPTKSYGGLLVACETPALLYGLSIDKPRMSATSVEPFLRKIFPVSEKKNCAETWKNSYDGCSEMQMT